MPKTLAGPRLRQLRREHKHTQAQMAERLGVSASYVNLLENNQRSLSVPVLVALTDAYGVDWRDLVTDGATGQLADLRAAVRDPMFAAGQAPDLQELRAALDHAPRLVQHFLSLYQNHRATVDQMSHLGGTGAMPDLLEKSPETAIYEYFRNHKNHFAELEAAAATIRGEIDSASDELYSALKRRLTLRHGLEVDIAGIAEMPDALRDFDDRLGRVRLSEALDHPNRIFQLATVIALVEARDVLDRLIEESGLADAAGRARCRVELMNYFAAALLMPYEAVLELAEQSRYDIDRIAAAFGVSFEQVCHRLTTLQRDGARGVPFFFLRIDKAGNVTKRFNATEFTLAQQGGACPVWNIHAAFRAPGVIHPQFVELPDGARFFTLSRTTDRPVFSRQTQDRRLVVTLGCERSHAHRVGYTDAFNLDSGDLFAPIGINCHLCPRQHCSQRAHRPMFVTLPIEPSRRGTTRYES